MRKIICRNFGPHNHLALTSKQGVLACVRAGTLANGGACIAR